MVGISRGNHPSFPQGPSWKGCRVPARPAAAASKRLDEMRAAGISAIEVYAPAEAGNSFLGLDTIDRYRLEPRVGTMEDFKQLVRLAHAKGMRVINIDNFGYSSVEAVDFLKACDDVKVGKDTRESSFFLWSDSPDAPPPVAATRDAYFMARPAHLPGYDSKRHEFWQYSERARRYYWTKWAGTDRAGNKVRLPQYNWASRELQEEAERIIRFWMDTGIDGMVIDAVNWYVDHTWEAGRRRMTDVIAGYTNTYIQPEGAGGFREDPVAWITEGGWNSVQDYGLGIWWEKGTNVIANAIQSGDPRPIERALRDYHDRVVSAGGVLYFQPPRLEQKKQETFGFAVLACLGDLIQIEYSPSRQMDPELSWILKAKAAHAALQQLSVRRQLPTQSDEKYYAFLRTAADGSERILVVLNFQPTAQTVKVDLSGVATERLIELKTGRTYDRETFLKVELAAFDYRLFLLAPARRQP
jgi:glycosidase